MLRGEAMTDHMEHRYCHQVRLGHICHWYHPHRQVPHGTACNLCNRNQFNVLNPFVRLTVKKRTTTITSRPNGRLRF